MFHVEHIKTLIKMTYDINGENHKLIRTVNLSEQVYEGYIVECYEVNTKDGKRFFESFSNASLGANKYNTLDEMNAFYDEWLLEK